MKVLVDTSVWIAHFRRSDPHMQALLGDGALFMHPAVLGELACGNLLRREEVLADLKRLPSAVVAERDDTLFVIESHRLWGRGIGWTDAQLVASALLTRCKLWTHDKQLREVARGLRIAH